MGGRGLENESVNLAQGSFNGGADTFSMEGEGTWLL